MRSAKPLVMAGLLAVCSSCAAVLGFEDALDLHGDPLAAKSGDEDARAGDAGAPADGSGREPTTEASSPPGPSGGDATPESGGAAVTTSTCVPAPPAEWNGPLAIYLRNGSTLPACDGTYGTHVYDGFASPTSAPASCACTCGAPTGVGCSASTIDLFADVGCLVGCGAPAQPIATSSLCTAIDMTGCDNPRMRITAGEPSGGACAPVATQNVPPPSWASSARLCARSAGLPPSTSCAEGHVAALKTSGPFEADSYCVARQGEWECPSGYPHAHTFHEDVEDTRACTSCTCGEPSGATCDGPTGYSGPSCGSGAKPLDKATCGPLGSTKSATSPATATGGSCAPVGGEPTGAVTPITPTTVCCTK
jgi:hypothetical protein